MQLNLLWLALALPIALLAETPSARPTTMVDGKIYPVYVFGAEITPLSRVTPVYPYAALQEKRGGTVYVGALVNEKGKVRKAYVEKSDAGKDLQQAALRAVEDWKFPVM